MNDQPETAITYYHGNRARGIGRYPEYALMDCPMPGNTAALSVTAVFFDENGIPTAAPYPRALVDLHTMNRTFPLYPALDEDYEAEIRRDIAPLIAFCEALREKLEEANAKADAPQLAIVGGDFNPKRGRR